MLPQLAVSAKILCLLMVVICGAVPSMVRSVALYSQCSYGFLRVYPNGTVMAKDNDIGDQYQNLTISSEGLDLELLIYAADVRRYLCFNLTSKSVVGLRISKKRALRVPTCRFHETMSDGYNTYRSVADPSRFITFNGHGVQPPPRKALAPVMRKCRGFIKKDQSFNIQGHNSRITGMGDVDTRVTHHKRAHISKRPKQPRGFQRGPNFRKKLRHAHSRKKKHYDYDTT